MDVFLFEDHMAYMDRELKEQARANGTRAKGVRKGGRGRR